jgi:dTDP-4-amino-4,6-dideoxygalactose transaminase
MAAKDIHFMVPDITKREINEVVDTLRSGWLTTGKKTKQFEQDISLYCKAGKTLCLNSATAGLELALRFFDIGEGDEVVTTPYTFAATANVILHTGAKPVFVDVKKGEFNIDPEKIGKAITGKTKAIIPVDIGGWPCDYDEIKNAIESNKKKFKPKKGTIQAKLGRPLLVADAAHSLGAEYKGGKTGTLADFTVFSFHVTKNMTTAEGGAVTFDAFGGLTVDSIYKKLSLLALHGQSKDSYSKFKLSGGWKYSIDLIGYKCNLTDLAASVGLVQLKRYDKELKKKREYFFNMYEKGFGGDQRFILPPFQQKDKTGSFHLFPLRIKDADENKRDILIQKLTEKNISVNVHFIPVVMHPAYQRLGFRIKDFPNTYEMFKNEISLPLHSMLKGAEVQRVIKELKSIA